MSCQSFSKCFKISSGGRLRALNFYGNTFEIISRAECKSKCPILNESTLFYRQVYTSSMAEGNKNLYPGVAIFSTYVGSLIGTLSRRIILFCKI